VEINLTDYPEKRKDMLQLARRLTVPQIFFGSKHIGGASDLEELEKRGNLSELYEGMLKETWTRQPLLEKPNWPPNPPKQPAPRTNSTIKVQSTDMSFGELSKVLKQGLTFTNPFCLVRNSLPIFKGSSLLFLLEQKFGLDGHDALNLATKLHEFGIIRKRDHSGTFQMKDDYFLHMDSHPCTLNAFRVWNDRVQDPLVVVGQLNSTLSKVLSRHRGKDGLVDYICARVDPEFLDFEESTCEISRIPLTDLSVDFRKAFWINLYNLIVLHAMVKVGVPSNSLGRLAYFDQVGYNVGGKFFSLSDIEHGILRENMIAPYHVSKQLSSSDERLHFILPKDPRIHFALNCGAKSCPPIKTFTSIGIDEELSIVAEAFLEQDENCRVDLDTNTLHLSTIFKWYKVDFGDSPKNVADCIMPWLPDEKQAKLQQLVARNFRIVYEHYDWSNDASRIESYNTFGD
jgi:glutaredoxin-related protein